MIKTEIFIEGNRLDLYKDISSEFTYNIDDVKDFSSRNTNFSKTIILPGNATNNQLFGNIFEFGSANFYNGESSNVGYNFNPAKSATCIILVDGIQVFKGIIRLLEIVLDRESVEYECAVFGELGGLVSSISNKKIEDLDFSAYDELWTKDHITASWDWASGSTGKGYGVYYPLIDYGSSSYNSKNDWHYSAFRPALYVKEYIQKIIEDAGYTYESQFFNSALFSRLIIPNNQKELSNFVTKHISADAVPMLNKNTELNVEWSNISAVGFDVDNYTTFYWTSAVSSITTTLRFNLSGTFEYPAGATPNLYLKLYKNNTLFSTGILSTGDGSGRTDFTTSLEQSITLNNGEYFAITISSNATSYDYSIFDGTMISESQTAVITPIAYGGQIFMNSITPRGIYQKDFLSSIVKMFNLYIVESTDKEKHLMIEPYIDFYTTTAGFLKIDDSDFLLIDNTNFLLIDDASASYKDWTYKVDRRKPFRIKPMSELNGRYYEFKYKQDNDYYNEQYFKKYSQGYGDRLEDTGYEFANDKQTAEVIFSATPLVGYNGQEKVFPTIFKLSNTNNSQSEDKIDHNIRIMQVHKVSGVTSWHIRENSGNIDGSLTSYGYAGHLNDPDEPTSDINFGSPKEIFFELATTYPSANLFNGFWSDYVAEITDKDSKLLTCDVLLNDMDIYNLDFSKLIYIDGSLWRLNKIIDYNPMSIDTTKCEFLKVIELTYA